MLSSLYDAAMNASSRPHRMASNRVPFFYSGGENIDKFRGEQAELQSPEDWVASMTAVVETALPPDAPRDTGVSRLPDGTSMRVAVEEDPIGWLGADLAARFDGNSALLVKLIDPGQRLPVHFHPSRAFATEHLASPFGKTEAWIVMDDAPGGEVWLGFREEISPDRLVDWVKRQAADEMLPLMNRLPALPGSVFYVPAGVPHAIGPGVMITELQEPTAFSILAEHDSFGVDDNEATLGLGWPTALAAADLSAYDASRLDRLSPPPTVLQEDADGRVVGLFAPEATEFFGAQRIELTGVRELPTGFQVLVVEAGSGVLESASGEVAVRHGETWVLPFAAGPARLSGELRVICCLPPRV
jgi:mannose-6-phosphate isomerase